MKRDQASPESCKVCGITEELALFLHHIHFEANMCRLCTNCLLKNHHGMFCPICFDVYDATPPPHLRLVCFECPSIAHRSCVAISSNTSKSYAPIPYFHCPSCADPKFSYFKLNGKNPSINEAKNADGERESVSVSPQKADGEGDSISASAQNADREGDPVSVSAQNAAGERDPVSVSARNADIEGDPVSVSAQNADGEGNPVSVSDQNTDGDGDPVSVSAQKADGEGDPVSVSAKNVDGEGGSVSVSSQNTQNYDAVDLKSAIALRAAAEIAVSSMEKAIMETVTSFLEKYSK